MPEKTLRALFETYQETTLVWREDGRIRGFALWQEWPDLLNIFCIAGDGTKTENLKMMLRGSRQMPQKKICYFDEETMELKTLCRR